MDQQLEMTELEKEIIRLLENCKGERNALRRRNLVEQLAYLTGERGVRKAIKHLVQQHGILIASTYAGYFTPVTLQEIWRACDYYHSYAMAALATESKLRRMIDGMIGQTQINFSAEGAEDAEKT